jgi:hypothetical protein
MQAPLLENWINSTGYGICDSSKVHSGTRLNDSADDTHEEAWFALGRGGQGGVMG